MKLKDFFFSTLPRSRKSKRKQSKNVLPDSNGSTNSEDNNILLRNHKIQSDIINGNNKKKKNRIPDLAANSLAQPDYISSISHNRFLVSSSFQYYTDNNSNSHTNPYGHYTLAKTPSNASESGFEDVCEHYFERYDSYSLQTKFQTGLNPSQGSDLHGNSFNTFPRERTRIKTNPWVTTHANTMTSSIHGQVIDNDMRCKLPYSVTPLSFNNFGSYDNNGNSDYHLDSSNCSSIPPDSSVPSSPTTDHGSYGNAKLQTYHSKEEGIVEGAELVINLKTGDVIVKSKPAFSPISFQYEEDLDATLERDNSRRKTKSRRKRAEDTRFYLKQDDVTAKMEGVQHDSDDELAVDFGDHLVDDNSDTDLDKESTLTRDGGTQQWSINNQCSRKRALRQRKYRMNAFVNGERDTSCTYSPYKTLTCDEDSEYDPRKCYQGNVAMFEMSHHREGTDSAYDSSTLSSVTGTSFHEQLSSLDRPETVDEHNQYHQPLTLPGIKHRKHNPHTPDLTNRRSLEEIHCGLKEKVCRLKAEKRLVDEKIQQAKEEEELRREEKARIEHQVSSLRKQVLLQTLQDLKDNLSDQSRRLQEAYDDVLDMQWLNAKLRRLRNTTL
jgi:hypothetical protein